MSQVESTPAIGISVQCQVSQERQIVFQCFVAADCDDATLNQALDKVILASQRQEARTRLVNAKEKMKRLEKFHHRAIEDMFRIDAEQGALAELRKTQDAQSMKRNPQRTAQQAQQDQKLLAERGNAETTLRRAREDIEELTAEIAELEQTLGG